MSFFKKEQEDVKVICPPVLGWLEKKLTDKEMEYLWRCIDNQKESYKNTLAGQIHESKKLIDRSDWFFSNTIKPLIDKYAKKGNPEAFKFTKPRVGDLEFSFSGLKSNILQVIQRESKKNPDFIKDNLYDLCASIQYTIISILLEKIDNAVKKTGITQIAIAGGVSANSGLRNALIKREKTHKWCVFIPKFEYCTDNAAMIGIVGYLKYLRKDFGSLEQPATARLAI